MSRGLPSNRIITNANAPVVEVKIVADNRYTPPQLAMQTSQVVPAVIVSGYLHDCLGNVLKMMLEVAGANPGALTIAAYLHDRMGEILKAMIEEASKVPGGKPPDLPPAPGPQPS